MQSKSSRIETIDLLKGFVMILMALDHTRDYFHSVAFLYDPLDANYTTIPIYLTRWITNFCAPVFCLLAGVSVYFVSLRKAKKELSIFLVKRGFWLIFLEFTIVNFSWYFDLEFKNLELLVIWSLGVSMLALAALIHLPKKVILLFSLILIFGHNLLDSIHFEGNVLWSILHEVSGFLITDNWNFYVGYPIIPWIAVMSLGYYIGDIYNKTFDVNKRKRILNYLGFGSIAVFLIFRFFNFYGNPTDWVSMETFTQTAMSFMNVHKYPPSLLYLLITLGPAFLYLAYSEKCKGSIVNFFTTFGRVPFLFYILHIYLIHLLALIMAEITGFGWRTMILDLWVTEDPTFKDHGYGFDLWVVYTAWILVIACLYPICKKYDLYKSNNKQKWWLSYL